MGSFVSTKRKTINERIIGINDVIFPHTQEYCSDRKNVIWISKQFGQIVNDHNFESNSFEHIFDLIDLFEEHKHKLTDVSIVISGYY